MSEETIKMLNIINNKIEKCKKDNNVNTLLAIPLGSMGDFGYLTDKMLNEIIELQERIDKAINNLEKSIESINNKLGDKEIRVENGIVVNPINDFRIVRLKAIRTKCKEILEILKGEKE